MTSTRIDAESRSVIPNDIGVGHFTSMPTNDAVVATEYDVHSSLVDVDNMGPNDKIEFRIPPLSGQYYVPAESYLKVDYIVQKRNQATMEDIADRLVQLTPNLGWPNI